MQARTLVETLMYRSDKARRASAPALELKPNYHLRQSVRGVVALFQPAAERFILIKKSSSTAVNCPGNDNRKCDLHSHVWI